MYPLWGVYQALRVGPIYPTSCFMFRTSRHRITFLLSPLPLEPNVTAVLTKITPERHAAEVLWKSSACVNFSDLKNDSHCTACNSNNSVAVRRLWSRCLWHVVALCKWANEILTSQDFPCEVLIYDAAVLWRWWLVSVISAKGSIDPFPPTCCAQNRVRNGAGQPLPSVLCHPSISRKWVSNVTGQNLWGQAFSMFVN